MRVVLEPPRPADLRVGARVPDRRVVRAPGQDVQDDVREAHLLEHALQVGRDVLGVRDGACPHGDLLALVHAGLVQQRLRLAQAVRVERQLSVRRVAGRKDVLRRPPEAAPHDPLHRLAVECEVDRAAHLHVVEGRNSRVHPDVVRVRGSRRVNDELALVLHARDPVRRDGGVRVVGASADHALRRRVGVADQLDLDFARVAARDVLRRLEVLVPHHREALVERVVRDPVRARRRDRPVLDRIRRSGRHRCGEAEREDRQEVAAWCGEPDRDRPLPVVRLDSRNVALERLLELFGPDDTLVEADTLSGRQELTLDRVLEVAGLHRLAVRVLQALAQLELVDLAVARNRGQRLRQPRNHLEAACPVHVAVRDKRRIDVPHRPHALCRVGLLRIQIVDRVDDGPERAEGLRMLWPCLRPGACDAIGRNDHRNAGRYGEYPKQPRPPSLPSHCTSPCIPSLCAHLRRTEDVAKRDPVRRVWRNVARRRGAMLVLRQGRRESL